MQKAQSDNEQADTRSGYGGVDTCGVLTRVSLCCVLIICSFSCLEPPFDEPEEGSRVFKNRMECLINGETLSCSNSWTYSRREYEQSIYSFYSEYGFTGWIFGEDGFFSGVNNDELAFCLSVHCNHKLPLFFYIVGDGNGPFEEGKDYSSPKNIVFYFPENTRYIDGLYNEHHWKTDDFDGLEVKLLSSSLRFGYSCSDEPYVGEMLDLYFDFEEVITGVPEGYDGSPSVGDTINVSNGHFVTSLYFLNKSILHQFVLPK